MQAYPPNGFRDAFQHQLSDIKVQLDRMQHNLTQRQLLGAGSFQAATYVNSSDDCPSNDATSYLPQPPYMGGPSGPIFWDMYTALKNDVRHIDDRVYGLEQSMSEFEDRLDSLDPRRFTPPGSEAGTDEVFRADRANNSAKTSPAVDLSALSNINTARGRDAAAAQGLLVLVAQLARTHLNHDGAKHETDRLVARPNPESLSSPAEWTTGVEFRDKEIERLDELLTITTATSKANEDSLAKKDERLASLTRELQEVQDNAAHVADVFQNQSRHLAESNNNLRFELEKSNSSRQHFMTKYVDENYRFRWLKQKKLQSEHGLQQRVQQLEVLLQQVEQSSEAVTRHSLASRDEEIDRLQAFCEEKDAVTCQQDEIITRGARLIEERDVEIDDLRRSKHKSARSRDFAIEAHEKLTGVVKQREDEITSLKTQLRREKDRHANLCQSMRRDVEAISHGKSTAREDDASHDVLADEPNHISEPLARAADALKNGRCIQPHSSWSPRPLGEYSRLPHEESRALAWESGVRRHDAHSFGSVSPINPSFRKASTSHRANSNASHASEAQGSSAPNRQEVEVRASTPASRHSTIGQHSRRTPSVELPSGVDHYERPVTSRRSAQRGRHALPLDASFWPPLPAPLAAGSRVGSVPDLRADRQDAGKTLTPIMKHSPISKPAPMRDLPNASRLQAYVTSEAESGEDRSGSSLLD